VTAKPSFIALTISVCEISRRNWSSMRLGSSVETAALASCVGVAR
jgi:hypothetical protein